MSAALEVRDLRLAFGGLVVTDDVTLSLPVGARTALIGPNGAGKTTLVNQICGMLTPSAGRIMLMGEDITNLPQASRVHRGLIRSFQVTQLFPDLTVAEHVVLAVLAQARQTGGVWRPMMRRGETRERAQVHLDQLGLAPIEDRRTGEIAYGEQRLVEIAIALAMQPCVLLLDEPAAGIPREGMELVTDALAALPEDLAVIMIDHDMDLVRRFARHVVVLASGRVIAAGTPAEISHDAAVRTAYLGT